MDQTGSAGRKEVLVAYFVRYNLGLATLSCLVRAGCHGMQRAKDALVLDLSGAGQSLVDRRISRASHGGRVQVGGMKGEESGREGERKGSKRLSSLCQLEG